MKIQNGQFLFLDEEGKIIEFPKKGMRMRMSRKIILPLTISLVLLFSATSGFSYQYPVSAWDTIKVYDYFGTTGGGEFIVDPQNPNTNANFITFCLEIKEFFYPGETLTVKSVSDYAEYNGDGPLSGTKDYLSDQTAWLYWSFVTKTLANYDFNDTGALRIADANSLQLAIWDFEEENYASLGLSLNQQAKDWIAAANAAVAGGWKNDGKVKVMNLATFTIETPKQDMLVAAVPEPLSMLLFGTGLLGIGAYFRMRFKK